MKLCMYIPQLIKSQKCFTVSCNYHRIDKREFTRGVYNIKKHSVYLGNHFSFRSVMVSGYFKPKPINI